MITKSRATRDIDVRCLRSASEMEHDMRNLRDKVEFSCKEPVHIDKDYLEFLQDMRNEFRNAHDLDEAVISAMMADMMKDKLQFDGSIPIPRRLMTIAQEQVDNYLKCLKYESETFS